jgi:hypothetical protein
MVKREGMHAGARPRSNVQLGTDGGYTNHSELSGTGRICVYLVDRRRRGHCEE